MPGSYGTSAFKSSGRREPKAAAASATANASYIGSDANKGPTKAPANACFRSRSSRFEPDRRNPTSNADFYTPPGMGSGAGVKRTAACSFKQTAPRFVDPTHPVATPGALDSDTPVTGLADRIRARQQAVKRTSSAAFIKVSDRFAHDPRVGKAPTVDADFYVPPGMGSSGGKGAPKFRRDGTRRFEEPRSATAAVEGVTLPGAIDGLLKRKSTGFGKAAPRWKENKLGNDRGADFYVPATEAKGGATAAFRASPRFKDADGPTGDAAGSSRGRSTSADARTMDAGAFVPPSFVDDVKASPASAAFRSASPRFERIRSETVTAEYAAPEKLTGSAKPCPASANFRSKTPRAASASRDRTGSAEPPLYSPPSFVDEILKR